MCFFSITKNASGEYELNYVGKGSGGGGTTSKPLEGYELFTIGTSSDVNGWWQKRVCELTGCTFDVTKNKLPSAPLSVGGTIQFGPRLDNGVFRTKNLINQGYITNEGENAIIIINSGNDAVTLCSNVEQIEAKDVFDSNARTYNPSDPTEVSEFSQGYLLSIPLADRDINAVYRAPNAQATSGYSTYYYAGDDTEDTNWGKVSNWTMDYNFKFSNAWKTTIDMLQRRFPRAHIFVMAAEIMSGDSSSYLLPNGTYDTSTYENTLRPKLGKHHAQVMKQIAEYYNVGFIDVCNNCGYSIVNLNTYKPVNNIHYYDNGIGYRLRGEQVATQLLSQMLK